MLRRASSLVAGRRSKWVVIGAWLLVAAVLAPFQPKLQAEAEDESETFLVRGSESAEAKRLLDDRFTFGSEVATVILYDLPPGAYVESAYGERILSDGEAVCTPGTIPDLSLVITPFGVACGDLSPSLGPETPPSPIGLDGSAALTTVLSLEDDTERVTANVSTIREVVEPDASAPDGLNVHVTGRGGFDADRAEAVKGIDETLLAITAVLILTLLLLIYRSPLVAAVPLLVVAVAYLIAAGITWGLVEAGLTTISGQTTAILIVLMFGAGTDYCLLILARFREELGGRTDRNEAMARATERTGPAILSAGGTVVVAMLALGLADFNATREMGPILALGITVMVLAGLTLLPAVLVALGGRAFWPATRALARSASEGRQGRIWSRIGRLVRDRPAATAITVTAILAAGALGNLDGREQLEFDEWFRHEPESVLGQEVVREKYPPGRVAPLDLVMTSRLSGEVVPGLNEVPGVDTAHWSAGSGGVDVDPELPVGELILAELVLDEDPFSDRGRDLVPEVRGEIDRLLREGIEAHGEVRGDEVAVLGGVTAETYDANQALGRDARLIVPVALALIFLVLVALLRAVVAPLYVIATVILSFAFALGISSLVFTHVFGQPASDPNLPIFAFIFLVGLGVDYNVFLISRMREERARGLESGEAAIAGLERTGGVITSAGLILAGTFCALMALPIEALFQIGFTIALGLLVDTFVVRVFLVPAIAVMLGERSWWPRGKAVASMR